MGKLQKFEPIPLEDIQARFFEKGVGALTDEDVCTLIGVLDARTSRLKAIRQIVTNEGIAPYWKVKDISDLVNRF